MSKPREHDKLSEGQERAIGTRCSCGGTFQRKSGRYGPFVGCSNFPRCRETVKRPRGIAVTQEQHTAETATLCPTCGDGRDPFCRTCGGAQTAKDTVVEPVQDHTVVYTSKPDPIPAPRAGSLEDAILQIVQPHITAAVQTAVSAAEDTESIGAAVAKAAAETLALVEAELAKLKAATPQVIELRRPDGATVTVTGKHKYYARLCKLLSAGFHVYVWGPAGSGKTTAVLEAAQELGLGGEVDSLDRSVMRSAIFGYRSMRDDSPVSTQFSRCWTDGGVYIKDELDNAPASVQTLYNAAYANGHVSFPWGTVAKHANFRGAGTGNTPGKPTREFPDRAPMSEAFKDRLYFIYWPLDENLERVKCGMPLAPVAAEATPAPITAAQWGAWVLAARSWAASNAPTMMITPRATYDGLKALALGETPEQVADALVFRGADAELRSKLLAAVPLPR